MSRPTNADEPNRANPNAERRDSATPRMHYEALVEVGSGTAGGFEAESVDVSPEGLRLRTAYLPDMGERLVCRFDGFGGEVVAEGEVVWRREQGRGGEFGLRFLGLDERGAELLQAMCHPKTEDTSEDEETVRSEAALVGSRVKLHIEGLGAPMRARVKDTARGEVLVGSSLEFLRVGRGIELEDVELGGRRTALIEHVGVEIDRENQIPQLVVTLRFADGTSATTSFDSLPTPKRVAAAPVAMPEPVVVSRDSSVGGEPMRAKETTPEPTVVDHDDSVLPPHAQAAAAGAMRLETASGAEEDAPQTLATPSLAPPEEPVDLSEFKTPSSVRMAAEAAGRKVGDVARIVGPRLVAAGSSVKGTLGTILEAVRQKRESSEGVRSVRASKRMTAPPPSGALRTDGRRVVRDASDEGSTGVADGAEVAGLDPRRKALRASIVAASVVVGVYAVFALVGGKPAESTAALSAATEEPAAATAPQGSDGSIAGSGVATANVPMFGAVQLSTSEPVPVPPNPELLGSTVEGGAPSPSEGNPADAAVAPVDNLQRRWGIGRVHDPVSLKVTMDGTVDGFSAKETPDGFTIVVPGRKSVTSTGGFTDRDPRIESFNVVDRGDRAEIAVRFKGTVPAVDVRASGSRVSIALDRGRDEDGESGATTKVESVKSAASDKADKPSARSKRRAVADKTDKADKADKTDKADKADKKSATKSATKSEARKTGKKSDRKKSK